MEYNNCKYFIGYRSSDVIGARTRNANFSLQYQRSKNKMFGF
jgi:histidinol phosphatase-like enzyme